MAQVCLLTALLAGPAPELPLPRTAAPPAAETFRGEYAGLMRRFAGRQRPDPSEVVPPLVDLHAQFALSKDLAHADRRRMTRGVENRLVELRGRMMRERRDRSRAGGPAVARADELIRLIETTVSPETWAVNGGRGTIVFWAQNPALVARQTGEVHDQIGGTLGALRK